MQIHLTDTTGRLKRDRGNNIKQLLSEENHHNHLYSFAYPNQEKDWAIAWERSLVLSSDPVIDLRPRVIIDSGAFTAFTTGKPIKPQDYGRWALGFNDRWEDKMSFLRFMNLDVIGDQDASWINQSILEKMGINPIPIVTYGAELKHLTRAIDEYDYIALGGLVPYSRQKGKLQTWLDKCFKIIVSKYKQTGVMPKIHLLGITTDWVLKRYPCYRVDRKTAVIHAADIRSTR